jgi:integrase
MGNLFKRKKGNGDALTWQMRYRAWDSARGRWGDYKYESSHTANRREAEALLHERELREERIRLGVEASTARIHLGRALTTFLDDTQAWDRDVPERNRAVRHPVLGIEVKGTAWWTRTVELAGEVFHFFGDVDVSVLGERGKVALFDRWLSQKGGARGKGVGSSTRHKALTWLRRFSRWAMTKGYLASDPFAEVTIPREVVVRRDRIIDGDESGKFWAEFQKLPLKAKVRVGLGLWTGARSGEIETIRASDVSKQFGTVRRRLWKTSRSDAAKETVVKVPLELMAILAMWIETQKLGPNDRLLPIRCQAGVKFLRRWATSMRGMRRTVLTRLHDAGVPLRVIQEAAGHSKLDTTQRYLGVGERAVNDALSSLDWGQGVPPKVPSPRAAAPKERAEIEADRRKGGATENAINPLHHTTTDRALTRHVDGDDEDASTKPSVG